MCSSKCGVRLQVENNTIVKIANMKEHLLNRMCPKGAGMSN